MFDWLHPEVVHLPYIDRLHKLKDYVRNQGWALDGIHVVKYEIVNNAKKEVEAFYQKCLDEGYEGLCSAILMVNINQDVLLSKRMISYEI